MTDLESSEPLWTLAKVVRSKNAGPFQLTLDLMFRTASDYARVKHSEALTRETIAEAYRIPLDRVHRVHFWDAALAVKITLDRAVSAGAPGDNDCYGAQQHAPLLGLTVPCRPSSE
jgi:hypothetical protein